MIDLNSFHIEQFPYIALDTETTGLQWWKDSAFALSLSCPDGTDLCLDLRNPANVAWARAELPKVKAIVGHNLKFDAHFMLNHGVDITKVPIHDTMVYAALLNEHRLRYDLDAIGLELIGVGKDVTIYDELAKIFGGKPTKEAQAPNFARAPWELLSKYAMQDTRTTLGVFEAEIPKLAAQELGRVRALEMDLLPVLLRIERGGVRVDLDKAEAAVPKITAEINRLQAELNALAGFPVDVLGRTSLTALFKPTFREGNWWLVDGTLAQKTKKGDKPSLDADCLKRMTHPAAKLILDVRILTKTRDTFLLGHILGSHNHGYVHATFNQTRTASEEGGTYGTSSGRLSCSDPNLQQISKRNKKIAAIVRAMFLPDPDQQWLCNDWSQMDFRIMSHFLNSPHINEMYANDPDTDFHSLVAKITGLPRSPTSEVKGNAKSINLGLCFGMGQGRLAKEMGLPFTTEVRPDGREFLSPGPEAICIFEQYHQAFPGIRQMLERMTLVARDRGYIRTMMGRRCRFPGGRGTHKAGALIFQGNAAEALKIKLVEVDKFLKSPNRLMLNVHDEFAVSTPYGEEGEETRRNMTRICEDFGPDSMLPLNVPIRSDGTFGPNWWEASK